MEFNDVVNIRRTVRDFDKKEVPNQIITQSLIAGLKAPSYNHSKEWDYILVKDQSTRYALTQSEKMVDCVTDEIKESFNAHEDISRAMYLDAIPKQKRMILEAPELLIVVYKPKTTIQESNIVYDLNGLASVWCCIENILLSLANSNVFGVTFVPKNTKTMKSILDIPQDLEIAAIIPFGYKAPNAIEILQKHVDLEEKLHVNQW